MRARPGERLSLPPRHGLEAVAIVAVISASSGTAWLPERGMPGLLSCIERVLIHAPIGVDRIDPVPQMERDPQLWDARVDFRGRTVGGQPQGTAADELLCEPRNPSPAQDGPPVSLSGPRCCFARSQATQNGPEEPSDSRRARLVFQFAGCYRNPCLTGALPGRC